MGALLDPFKEINMRQQQRIARYVAIEQQKPEVTSDEVVVPTFAAVVQAELAADVAAVTEEVAIPKPKKFPPKKKKPEDVTP